MHDTTMRGSGPHTWQVFVNDLNSSIMVRTRTRSAQAALMVARQVLDAEGRRNTTIFRPTPIRPLRENITR